MKRKPVKKTIVKKTEHLEQKTIIDWRNTYVRFDQRLSLLFAVPNAGKRSFAAAAWLRAEGVTRGVPDLLLLAPDYMGTFNFLAIEMKTKKGKLTQEQIEMLNNISALGRGRAWVCYSAQEAIARICFHLGLPTDWIPR